MLSAWSPRRRWRGFTQIGRLHLCRTRRSPTGSPLWICHDTRCARAIDRPMRSVPYPSLSVRPVHSQHVSSSPRETYRQKRSTTEACGLERTMSGDPVRHCCWYWRLHNAFACVGRSHPSIRHDAFMQLAPRCQTAWAYHASLRLPGGTERRQHSSGRSTRRRCHVDPSQERASGQFPAP